MHFTCISFFLDYCLLTGLPPCTSWLPPPWLAHSTVYSQHSLCPADALLPTAPKDPFKTLSDHVTPLLKTFKTLLFPSEYKPHTFHDLLALPVICTRFWPLWLRLLLLCSIHAGLHAVPQIHQICSHLKAFALPVPPTWNALCPDIHMTHYLPTSGSLFKYCHLSKAFSGHPT